MIIKTYQDLTQLGDNEAQRMAFVFDAIADHKASADYAKATDAELYATGKNATISKYQKVLYTMTGKAVPDNYTANHKCKSGFFKRFVTQETAYLMGNGVTFQSENTKNKLGADFDTRIYKAVKSSLIQGVSFGLYNLDHVEFYKLTEFVPLYDEETGLLMAGVRFWQLDNDKPLRATLFEIDGYTDYISTDSEQSVLNAKRPYKQIVRQSLVGGTEIEPGGNYPSFPIVPLYGNMEKQSELVGIREQIDCYDLIKSGFANDLDDASMIYWTLKNSGGMDDTDLAKFVEHMKTIKAAVVDSSEDGASAEAHTMDVPYQSREVYLSMLEKDLYKDFMALNVEQIAAGNVTATQIQAAYEPMNEKADELEMCLCEFINGLLAVAGMDDKPTFERSQISNQTELTNMVLSAAEYLDDETILRKLPFLTADEIDGILKRKDAEEMDRYKQQEKELEALKSQQTENGGGEE